MSKHQNVERSNEISSGAADEQNDRAHFDVSTFRHFDIALPHVAIRASAGSGKTFQLTNRYLQLIAAGAQPSTILASTFTRLAAGQIRDRILTRLAEAALNQKKCEELAQQLGLKSLDRAAVQAILARLAKHMHVMQIRTLDSFFAAIVQAFSLELQVPIGAEVVDEEQAAALRSEAIRLMLDEHDPQKLVDLLRLLTQGAADRAITSRIDSVVGALYELWREAPDEAWDCVPPLPGRLTPPQLVAAIKRLEDAACPGDGRFMGAFQKDCEAARAWRWEKFLGGGMAKIVASGGASYYKKPIPDALIKAYTPLVQHAIAELIGWARDQTQATRDILAAFHVQYEKIKRRNRAVTFADLAGAMANAQQREGFDEIAFRLDAKLAHLLLDEFQDTSITQWRALAPLAHEITSVLPPEKSFFCVGDVKQSIYRWRNAAPEVLDQLPNLLPGIQVRTLAKSYRSAPQIMDAVNRVFESIEQNPAMEEFPDAAAAWRSGFEHHETDKIEYPGYVELRCCRRAEDDENAHAIRLRCAAELAAELHRANPNISIAVLTRTNKAVGRLLYELGPSRLNVAGGVSGRGGGPLTDAAPVNVILDMLQLADHPDDTAAAFNVAMSPIGEIVRELCALELNYKDHREHRENARNGNRNTSSVNSVSAVFQNKLGQTWWRDEVVRHAFSRGVRRAVLDDGYGKTIAGWVQAISNCGAADARELRRLRELINLADSYDRVATLRTNDFVKVVEQSKVADIQPAAVQVMTIHQAKGLEFDAVILAELGAKLTGENTPAVVVERGGSGEDASETGPITRVCRYLKQDLLEYVLELQPMFARHQARVVRESLSVLYVAMTRAIYGLYMIINPPDVNKDGSASKKSLKTLAGVVSCALADGPAEPDSVLFQTGVADWPAKIETERKTLPFDQSQIEIKLALVKPGQRMSAAESASGEAESELSLSSRLRLPDAEARDRGSALHALFEQIEWIEDFAPDDARMLEIVRAKAPRRDVKWARAQVDDFARCLKLPEVCAALSRGKSPSGPVRVHREHPYARIVDGSLQRGVIDRLIVNLNPDCTVAFATIIDFKTDVTGADAVRSQAEHYRVQMETYRDAAAETLGIEHSKVQMKLLFVMPGVLVDLDVAAGPS